MIYTDRKKMAVDGRCRKMKSEVKSIIKDVI